MKKYIIFILIFLILIFKINSISYYQYQLSEMNYMTQDEKEVIDLVNEYRNQNGLENLISVKDLEIITRTKARDLESNNYFSHTSPILGTPFEMLKQNGIGYEIAGENLAGNTTSKRAVEAWINSKSHKENILNKNYKYTGVAVVESQTYGKIFVQIFIGIGDD